MGEDLENFHALVDQLHGLTIGSFDNVNDSEDCDSYLNYCPDDGANNPYAKFETRELSSLLTDAIDALPEKEQLVLSLYYYEEFTMKEIGALLGVNESRVSQLHTKAMLRLRGKIGRVVAGAEKALRAMSAS